MTQILKAIDDINAWIGRVVAWSMVLVMILTVWDVIARKFFAAPVPWAFDVSIQLFALHFMLGAAWALATEEHVSINVFSERLGVRMRAALEVVGFIVLFFPFVIAILVYGWGFAARSWASAETSWGVVALPLYYVKTVIPIAAAMLILQGFATVVRKTRIALGRPSP